MKNAYINTTSLLAGHKPCQVVIVVENENKSG